MGQDAAALYFGQALLRGPASRPLSDSQVLFADMDGTVSYGTIDVSGLVPYTGATTDVDLGSHGLTTTGQVTAGVFMGAAGTNGATLLKNPNRPLNGFGFRDGYPAFRSSDTANTSDVVAFGGLNIKSTWGLGWTSSATDAYGTPDAKLTRYATGPAVQVQAAGGLRVTDLAGTTLGQLYTGSVRLGTSTGPQIQRVDDSTIGVYEDDGTTPAMLQAGTVQSTSSGAPWFMGRFRGSNGGGIAMDGGGNPTVLAANSIQTIAVLSSLQRMWANYAIEWADTNNVGGTLSTATTDLVLGRAAANVLGIYNNTAKTSAGAIRFGPTGPQLQRVDDSTIGAYEDDGTTLAAINCGAISPSGQIKATGNLTLNSTNSGNAAIDIQVANSSRFRWNSTYGWESFSNLYPNSNNSLNLGNGALPRRWANVYAVKLDASDGIAFRSGSADPSTGDITAGTGIGWKNTTSGDCFFAVNDGGVIKKVLLS